MCLGIPAKIIAVDKGRRTALVETMGLRSKAGIELVKDASPGDYVMVHAGQAVARIDLAEAAERIKLWEEILTIERAAALPGPLTG